LTLTARQRETLVNRARNHLDPGEVVLDVTVGALYLPDRRRRDRFRAHAMSLLVTDRRLLFFRKRWRGQEVHSVELGHIQSVGHQRGFKLGELYLVVPGREMVRVSSMPADDVERIARLIRDHLGR
jgi:PH (Pleckstrin Homology) domain-containing protein